MGMDTNTDSFGSTIHRHQQGLLQALFMDISTVLTASTVYGSLWRRLDTEHEQNFISHILFVAQIQDAHSVGLRVQGQNQHTLQAAVWTPLDL